MIFSLSIVIQISLYIIYNHPYSSETTDTKRTKSWRRAWRDGWFLLKWLSAIWRRGYEVKKGFTLEAESESGALNGGTTSLQVCGVAVDFVN